MSQTNNIVGSKISTSPKNDNFAVLCIHLELRRELKEDYMKVRESKAGKFLLLDYTIVNKIIYSIEGGYASKGSQKEYTLDFQKSVNLDAQE